MGNVVTTFEALAGVNSGSQIAELYVPASSTSYAPSWAFIVGQGQAISFTCRAVNYAAGNITADIDWHAPEAGGAAGNAVWSVEVACQTPADAEAFDSAAAGTALTGTTTANATLGGPSRTTITIPPANADSIASGDCVRVTVRLSGTSTIGARAMLDRLTLTWSDGIVAATGDAIGAASSVSANVVTFAGADGKQLADSGIAASSLVRGSGAVGASNIAVYNGTTGTLVTDGGQTISQLLAAAGDVDGPASSVAGNLLSFAGTTGKVAADSGIAATNVNTTVTAGGANEIAVFSGTGKALLAGGTTIGSVVKNTGPSVISDNLVKFTGTSGLNILDSGIALANVAQTATAKAAGDVLRWNGSTWVPKLDALAVMTATFTITSTTFADITGLSIVIPRAGSYYVQVGGSCSTVTTAQALQFCFNFTGTVTAMAVTGVWSTPTAGYFAYQTQTANNALVASVATGTAAPGANQQLDYRGGITVSTAGTLTFRGLRPTASGTTTVLAGTGMTVTEV